MPNLIATITRIGVRYRRIIAVLVVAIVAGIGFEALRLILHQVHLSDVRAAISAVPRTRIGMALALTVLSYLALTFYDTIALQVIGRPQRWLVAATASFTSYTISHNLGLSLLTGGSARYRVYTSVGLDLGDVARVSALASLTFWGGIISTGGLALLAASDGFALGPIALSAGECRALGIGVIALLAGIFLLLRTRGERILRIGGASLPLPNNRQLLKLGGVTLLDVLTASAALFVLLPGLGATMFPIFFLAYVLALLAALVTHVPGGLGVFEAVMLAMLPNDHPAVFAGLLLYRIIYYLLPLLVAGALITVAEGKRLRQPIGTGLSLLDRAGRAMAPSAVTLLVFTAGFILLVSGALPGVKTRLTSLDDVVPLPFIEGSHLGGSLIGTALLLVAPALNARLQSGFQMARLLLIGGAIFSLFKGLDYEEAAMMLAIAGLLQYCRHGFYRKAGLLTGPIDWAWLSAAAIAVALSLWAGFFAYKRTPYSDDLWWHFAVNGNAPRFLRASFAAGILLSATAFWHLLSGRRPRAEPGILPDSVAARAFAFAERTDANLAFTGDKSFIVSRAGDAFLMYRIHGRTWIVMGDPVGPRAAWGELVWAVRRACDAPRGRLCFFQASEAMLPFFVDLGLATIKYGEEATIPLDDFTLAGPQAKNLRHTTRRAEAAGLAFAVLPAADVPALIPELRAISDAWLAEKGGTDKHFSLGAFDPEYLERFPLAVVRDGMRIVAFANIWTTQDGRELSVDLMRHATEAPYGTMDLLFVRLLDWGRAEGYARFNLGVAPLAGIEGNRLAPLWAKLARTLFENGERIYGFIGLRAFKAKYAPDWAPRYIATPGGARMVRALVDLVRVVGT